MVEIIFYKNLINFVLYFHQKEKSENIIMDKNINNLIDNITNNNNNKINYGSNFLEYNKHLNMNKSQSMENMMVSNLKYSNLKDTIEGIEYENNKFQNNFNKINKTTQIIKTIFLKIILMIEIQISFKKQILLKK